MITADLEYLAHQLPLTASFRTALEFLRRTGLDHLPDGTITLDGQKVYAIVQRYETVMTGTPRFEYHRSYIDVQFVVSGEEIIGWAPSSSMSITEAYDPDKDIAFGNVDRGRWTPLLLRAGQAAVLYPEDGHAPRLAADAACGVIKIVVKIAVEESR